ncbi:hypothetical protein LGN19_24165 [Burkholderia sp. AU30198]|uniref:hypothetical protein n=1 Tax=Burkholderia sp. AU30198 TaxID=2879627 RepID=UPI001CF2A7BB|nr:hypothetical protein [Burkholderia sp. AU30198]MCA8296892.1 hypothetical protein [Burkholderia sp. AU30198]
MSVQVSLSVYSPANDTLRTWQAINVLTSRWFRSANELNVTHGTTYAAILVDMPAVASEVVLEGAAAIGWHSMSVASESMSDHEEVKQDCDGAVQEPAVIVSMSDADNGHTSSFVLSGALASSAVAP